MARHEIAASVSGNHLGTCRRGALLALSLATVVACADAPPATELERLLPETVVALAGGVSEPIRFQVPPNALSVVISVVAEPGILVGLGSWSQPGGTVLVPEGWWTVRDSPPVSACAACPNRILPAYGAFAALAPNNPEVVLLPGEHLFTVIALPSVTAEVTQGELAVRVTVDAKVGDALAERGAIDLALHFASTYWSADRARQAPVFQGMLERADDLLATVGLELGRLRYVAADPAVTEVGDSLLPGSALHALLAQGTDSHELDVYFIDTLEDAGGGALRGLASGIPCGLGGGADGIVVALGASTRLDLTLVHELGHALGLFHTTEAYRGGGVPLVHDQLPDTPDGDPSLLMYHDLYGTRLTATQGVVMRSHPYVRPR